MLQLYNSLLALQVDAESEALADVRRSAPSNLLIPSADEPLGSDDELPVSSPSPNAYAALSDSYLSPDREHGPGRSPQIKLDAKKAEITL